MGTERIAKKLKFQRHGKRKVEGGFDGGMLTTDGGALLLREAELASGVCKSLAACFEDKRNPKQCKHTLEELVTQRVIGLCLGYEDLNDHEDLRKDLVLRLACGKKDIEKEELAGKSTLNRLELGPGKRGKKDRYKKISLKEEAFEEMLMDFCCQIYEKEPESIFLDFDTTDITLHGNQEDRHYHGYYGDYCYLPLYAFIGDIPVMAQLRAAWVEPAFEIEAVIEPLLARIRKRWPNVHIKIRCDGAFSRDELMSFVEKRAATQEKIDYILGLPGNKRLESLLGPAMEEAKNLYEQTKEASRVFQEFEYKTRDSWSAARRVIGKAEHLEKGANPRFIVTSLPQSAGNAQKLYESDYCGRGRAENCIKEQQLCLFADRTSCHEMSANQLRLYFSAAASILLHVVRTVGLKFTELATSLGSTIRLKVLKIGARVLVSARRIYLAFPTAFPSKLLFNTALSNLKLAYIPLRL